MEQNLPNAAHRMCLFTQLAASVFLCRLAARPEDNPGSTVVEQIEAILRPQMGDSTGELRILLDGE